MVGDAETAEPDVPRYQAVEQRRQNLPTRVGAATFGMLVELPNLSRVMGPWGLDCFAGGVPLEDLIQDFAWQEGWEYRLG